MRACLCICLCAGLPSAHLADAVLIPMLVSCADYIVKTLLGSIDPEFDKLDEVKGGCCSVQ